MGGVHHVGTAGEMGPQQNAIVNDQLAAAQSAETSAAHKRHVQDVAAEIADAADDTADN